MRLLVTGGGGQVGACIPGSVAASSDEVCAPDHAELDVSNAEQVDGLVSSFRPDAIVHCAAYTDVDGCERDPARAMAVNANGVRNVAVAAARAGAHLVHVSTDYVFDGDATTPYVEDAAVGPVSEYGRSKLEGERAVVAAGGSAVIARTAWVFGRRGKDFVSWVLSVAPGEPLRVVADQVGAPTYAPDLATALVDLAHRTTTGIVHVTNAGSCSRFEFARDILAAAGRDPSVVVPITTADLPRPARRPAYSVLGGGALAAAGVPPLRHYRDALEDYLGSAGNRGGAAPPSEPEGAST